LLTASISTPLVASASAFQNGSFENPGAGAFGIAAIASLADAPTGWSPAGTLSGGVLFYAGNGFAGAIANDGVNFIGFGGSGTTGATLSQAFDALAGVSYTASFYVTAIQLGDGPQSYSAEVLNGVTSLRRESASISQIFGWVKHSFSFVATGSFEHIALHGYQQCIGRF
jgi:hypothetical protein